MKQNYFKTNPLLMTFMALIIGALSYAQDIHFTFSNAENTNDGSDDYYEVDVLIQTINTTGTFKLGSGQLYFNYNTTAFGTNVEKNSGITVTNANPDFIAGQFVDIAAASIYGPFTTNDNTTSRVSWSFSQAFSRSTFAADNITDTPAKLCHLKIKYIDVNEDPMLVFEDGAIYDDQFFTACGLDSGGPFGSADCGAEAGSQIVNDTFESGGATLSNKDFELITGLSLYPNPVSNILNIDSQIEIERVVIFNLLGKQVLETSRTKQIDMSALATGMYLLNVYSENGRAIKKIIVE